MNTTQNKIESRLTVDERENLEYALFDCAIGYPEFPQPTWLADFWAQKSVSELVAEFCRRYPDIGIPPGLSAPNSIEIELRLRMQMLRFLGIDSSYIKSSIATQSTSISLNRVAAALINENSRVLITSPSIDIIPMFVKERNAEIHVVSADPDVDWKIDAGQFAQEIRNIRPNIVLICSPENPTGFFYSAAEIKILAVACSEIGATLVIDQCFSTVSISGEQIPLLPNNLTPNLSWVFLWDTGKTFDLDDEKVGLMVVSEDVFDELKRSLSVIQCVLPKNLMMNICMVLILAQEHSYSCYLSSLIQKNLRILKETLQYTSISVSSPSAGGFCLLDASSIDLSGKQFRNLLMQRKHVGTVCASSFFHEVENEIGNRYVRFSLLRHPDLIEKVSLLIKGAIEGE